jgi:N-ethylmaleimide reductase
MTARRPWPGPKAARWIWRPFISNPDLVACLKADAPLVEGDQATFYGGGDNGFTDDPTLELQAAE